MKRLEHKTEYFELSSSEELCEKEQGLIEKAQEAIANSYSPYSNFAVGAAVLLDTGEIIKGANQENAAYPSGLCAERVALFYANAQFPDKKIKAIAIAAKNVNGLLENPVAPCGACRQVMLESESRSKQDMRIFLIGKKKIYLIKSVGDLLPLHFDSDSLVF